ncbi:DUF1515 family protein [Ensifer adhaerens]|uniref:DUF1515 family protein n=1 Tax=Ensifer adhaerens TaxID=106592 RepID=UPI003B8476B3
MARRQLATVFHETGGTMHRMIENLNYSAPRPAEVWPSRQATTSRQVVHCRMNQLVDRVGHPKTSAITIGEAVSEMKLVTDDVRRWKLRHRWLGVTGIAARALGISQAEAIRRIIFVIMG